MIMKPEAKVIRPGVGLAGLILNGDKILMGLRKGSHGSGAWAPPGGHLEMFEDFDYSLMREIDEETGLVGKSLKLLDYNPCVVTNDFFEEDNKHYVTLFFKLQYLSGMPKVREPDKCEEWRWCYWDDLPSPLFKSIENLKEMDYNPFR
jgi:8-oxo-dGTP diphosphatase